MRVIPITIPAWLARLVMTDLYRRCILHGQAGRTYAGGRLEITLKTPNDEDANR